jgi:hypothetical protein
LRFFDIHWDIFHLLRKVHGVFLAFVVFFVLLGRLLETGLDEVRFLDIKNDGLRQALFDVDFVQLSGGVEHVDKILVGVETDLILILVEVGETIVLGGLREVKPDDGPELVEVLALVLDDLILAAVNEFDHFLGI